MTAPAKVRTCGECAYCAESWIGSCPDQSRDSAAAQEARSKATERLIDAVKRLVKAAKTASARMEDAWMGTEFIDNTIAAVESALKEVES